VTLVLALVFYGCAVKCEEQCENRPDCKQTCEIIKGLLRESAAFRAFYKAERNNITSCICWREAPNLPQDVDADTYPSYKMTLLRRIPPRIDDNFHDDFIVAHELCVYIMKEEGFPTLEIKPDVDNQDIQLICGASFNKDNIQLLCNSLIDMTSTPLRDSILSKYGFDLENAYREYTNVLLDQPAPTNDFVLLDSVFLYTRSVLYWEDVLHKTQPTGWQQQFFDNKYPRVAQQAGIILDKTRSIGYDTPEKMSELYLDILNWLHLQGIVETVRL
jgi:hypothetical protein